MQKTKLLICSTSRSFVELESLFKFDFSFLFLFLQIHNWGVMHDKLMIDGSITIWWAL